MTTKPLIIPCVVRMIAVTADIAAGTVDTFAGTVTPGNVQWSRTGQAARSSNHVFSFRCSRSARPSWLRKRILSFSQVRLLPVG